jgi:hypothetical protein
MDSGKREIPPGVSWPWPWRGTFHSAFCNRHSSFRQVRACSKRTSGRMIGGDGAGNQQVTDWAAAEVSAPDHRTSRRIITVSFAFMEQPDIHQLQREIRELRAEVRRTRHLFEGTVLIMALGAVLLFPNLLVIAIALAVLILFGILFSPLRRTIFQSLFQKERGR